MSWPSILRPEAQDDLLEARDWYDRQRHGLGASFADAFAEFLRHIEDNPEMYAVVLKGVRQGKLRRFPYVVSVTNTYRHPVAASCALLRRACTIFLTVPSTSARIWR